ncbi:MAG: arginine repressor [Oscillospiraceae bacterium]|nr:arginine repressor [Oscillospiraceae bacterium]
MKSKRQTEILRLIETQTIETQEQMLAALQACGIRATQATISRDIKELNLVKQQVQGVSKYVVAKEKQPHHNYGSRLKRIFKDSVVSFDIAQNIVVVKTMAGLASAAGAAVDDMDVEGLVGSLAGDDTVVLIMRNNQMADEFYRDLRSMLD